MRLRTFRSALPLGVFLLGLCMSGWFAWLLHSEIRIDAASQFHRLAGRTAAEIESRFNKPLYALKGAQGIFIASRHVQRAGFHAAMETRNLAQEFPGVRGIGFVERVERKRLESFVQGERADGAPGFQIRRLQETPHDDLFIVKFQEPSPRSPRVIGLDLGSEPARRSAIQQAIDTGHPAATATVALQGSADDTPGILVFVPVYQLGAELSLTEERQRALVGLVYAPIVIVELLGNLPDIQTGLLEFEVFDSPVGAARGTTMYSTSHGNSGHQASGGPGPRFESEQELYLPGRELSLRMVSTPQFEASVRQTTSWLVLLGGTVVSALLAFLVHQQTRGREIAEARASAMTADLRLLAEVVKHTANAVSTADIEGRITWVNEGFTRITGYSLEEAIGKTPARLVGSGKADPTALQTLSAAARDGLSCRVEILNQTKDGKEYWTDTEIQPRYDAQGQHVGFMEIGIDVTALMRATETARSASQAKSQFLANMSHEIRTPMSAILGMLTLLRRTPLTEKQADYAIKSERAAQSLLGLINEILDFSKIEAGKMALDVRAFAMDTLLRDVSALLSAGLGHKPVELRFDIDPRLPQTVVGDAMRIQQVLLNLGSNAIKFTARGTVVFSVLVVGSSHDTVTLLFSVRDTGIGIAPENQARIFSGFTQAEASITRRFGGTGLGLAISQRFVALMGAELKLESALGVGSRFFFTVTLPVGAGVLNSQPMQMKPGPGGHRLAQMRVLLVEDNINNQQIAKELLEDEGADVQIAEDGQQGVESVQRADPAYDVVLMDLQMPVMDGLAATRHIRSVLKITDLPIVAMSANAMASDREACMAAGMNDHVGKPFDLNNLVHILCEVTGRNRPEITTQWSDPLPLGVLQTAQREGIDLDSAVNRLGGRQDAYQRLLATFLKDLLAMPFQLQDFATAAKPLEAKRLLHTLKGLAATLGATDLAQNIAPLVQQVQAQTSGHRLSQVADQAGAAIRAASPGLLALLAALQQSPTQMPGSAIDDVIDTAPLDIPACFEMLRALETQLQNADMDAIQTVTDLQKRFGPAMRGQLDLLGEAVGTLDFEAALPICRTLMESLSV